MRSGELFAGYGGLALAVEEVFGARTAWVADVCGEPDKGRPHKSPHGAPCTILAERFPGVPNLGDVTAVDWAAVEPVDVIGGGSPCQDLSHAGKRAGMRAGTRSGLWASMCDAVETIRPRFVVWENVRGALSAAAAAGDLESCEFCMDGDGEPPLRALGRVLGDLAELGYDAAWTGLRAADVGAPHARWRVFVLAWDAHADPDDLGRARDRGARDGRPGPPHGGGDADLTLLPTPRATDGTKGGPNQRGSSGDLMLPSSVGVDFGQYAPAIARWEAVSGRHAPAPTEPTGRDGAARLSPLFVEWMMGLPAGWVTDVPAITRTEALRALGNGVVPQQAAAALRYLLTVRAQALATPGTTATELAAERDRRTRTRHEGKLP